VSTDSLVLESLEVAPTTHVLTKMRSQSALKRMGQPSSSNEDDSHSLGAVSSKDPDIEPLSEEVTDSVTT